MTNKKHRSLRVGTALTLVALTACSQDRAEPVGVGVTTAPLPWARNDRPEIFTSDLVYTLSDLPQEGTAKRIPWAGHYWPTAYDSINHVWDGDESQSPATKYAKAFGLEGVEDAVSRYYGIDSQTKSATCTTDEGCKEDVGERCAKRAGQEEGRCIATWFGICHAWAPAAILHAEPRKPVTRGEVTFKVQDIKALLSLAYDRGLVTKFASGRCSDDDRPNEDGTDGITYDAWGRPVSGDCIDTNPGTYHLLLANYLGIKGESFVEDRTYDDEVWNQPLAGFRVNELTEIDAQQANREIGLTEGGVETRHEGALAREEWKHFGPFEVLKGQQIIAEASGTGDADLYVRFGAEPTSQDHDCNSTSGSSSESCTATADADAQAWVSVYGFDEETSSFKLVVRSGVTTPGDYRFNANATRFFRVASTVDYISESPAHRDGMIGDEIDRYTRSDRYTYVLEVDAEGRIVGGEWTGRSKRDHVDFLWLPVRLSSHAVAGGKLDLDEILALYRESIEDDTNLTVVHESGAVATGEWVHFGPFHVAADSEVSVRLTGLNDADLYVRGDEAPNLRSFECRPYSDGTKETCHVLGGRDIFVSVHGYAASSDFALEIRYRSAEEPLPSPVEPLPSPVEPLPSPVEPLPSPVEP